MSVTQGRLGHVSIGGVAYPFYRWRMSAPRNIVQGIPIGNTYATNFEEGMRFGRFEGELMCRIKATEFLAAGFWDLFLTRTWASGVDDTSGVTIIAGSGRKTRTLASAKAESFSLRVAKGQVVGLSVVFLAPGIPTEADTTSRTSYDKLSDNSAPLMFDKVTWTGVTGSIYNFNLMYSNNHLPNAPNDGTKVLTAWDAGVMTAGCQITMAERAAASGGFGASNPFSDAAALTVAMAGAITRTLTLASVIINDPMDADVNIGQVYQPLNCTVQGTASANPVAYS